MVANVRQVAVTLLAVVLDKLVVVTRMGLHELREAGKFPRFFASVSGPLMIEGGQHPLGEMRAQPRHGLPDNRRYK
jgi:hypothetical protein